MTRAIDTDNRNAADMIAYLEARVEALREAVKSEREENERLIGIVASLMADPFALSVDLDAAFKRWDRR
jgi:hypothetical protein